MCGTEAITGITTSATQPPMSAPRLLAISQGVPARQLPEDLELLISAAIGWSIFYDRVSFNFNQPIWINESDHLHDGVGRTDVGKKFAVHQRHLFPVFNAN